MHKRAIRILTNIRDLEQSALPEVPIYFSYPGSDSVLSFIASCLRSDLVILDSAVTKLMIACVIKWVLPLSRFRIISVDLILRPPKPFAGRAKTFLKKLLLKKVHQFILYFKDLRGYERFYGIGLQRTTYVPFKVNDWEILQQRPMPTTAGDYVLCAGRTLRDIGTFVEAVGQVGCPAVLLQQNRKLLSAHGTEQWDGALPANVRLVIDEGNESETFIEYISGARIVVIPRFRNDIAATGIGTYLLAMALNRCVIISEGPGANDVLTDQAVIVPPEDSAALAKHIESLWNDASLRDALVARGREYANLVAGEGRLVRDILRASIQSMKETEIKREQTNAVLFGAAEVRK